MRHLSSWYVLLVVGLVALSPAWSAAQLAQPGARVRVRSTSGDRVVGTLAAASGDSLHIAVTSTDTLALARQSVTSMEVSRGQVAHPVRGFLIGAVVGAVPGFAIDVLRAASEAPSQIGCAIAQGLSSNPGTCREAETAPVATLVGVAVGGFIGYGLGRRPRDQWVKVQVTRVPVMPPGGGHTATFLRLAVRLWY